MKKIIVLIIISILCTGCTITYEINIDRHMNFKEKIFVTGDVLEYGFGDINEKNKEYIIKTNEDKLIDLSNYKLIKNVINKSNYNVEVKSGKQKIENIKDAKTILKIYDHIDVNKKQNGNYTFKFSKTNKYAKDIEYDALEFDDLIVKIKSKKQIINSNANEIDEKNNIYIWNINGDKVEDIYFELTDKTVFKSEYIYMIIVILIVMCFLILILKSKKVNEIR